MLSPIIQIMLLSFVTGALGYTLFFFWFKPLMKYKMTRKKIITRVRALSTGKSGGIKKDQLKQIRSLGAKLVDIYFDELPKWYRMALMAKKEAPEKAAGLLTSFTHPGSVTQKRLEQVAEDLNFTISQAKQDKKDKGE